MSQYVVTAEKKITITLKDASMNEDNIQLSTEEWTNENVTVTLQTEKAGEIYYKIKEDGEWTKYESPFEISENAQIYTKLKYKDGDGPEFAKEITNIDKEGPTYTSVEIKNITTTGYDVYVYGVTDNGSGVNRVQFPTWTGSGSSSSDQDDLDKDWQTSEFSKGTLQEDGTTWIYRVNVTDHNSEFGMYATHLYLWDNVNNCTHIVADNKEIEVPGVEVNYLSGNLLYGLDQDVTETTSGYMKYSITNKKVTVTALKSDGYGFTTGRVYLEAGKTYKFSCNSTGTYPGQTEALLMLNGEYNYYMRMAENSNYEFTPTTTGTYWLRLDVNTSGETHTFSNLEIYEVVKTETKGYGSKLGTLPEPNRTGYTLSGWYTEKTGGTQITEDTTVPAEDTTYYAQWTKNNYTVTYSTNMQMTSYAYQSGFSIEKQTDSEGDYYRCSFNKTSGTSNTWYYISFPTYEFEEGATYRVRIKTRMQSVTNCTLDVRHSAIPNDYWTNWIYGKTVTGIQNIGEWKEYTLTRTFSKTYTNSSGTTCTTSPRIEIWTGNLALTDTITSRSITFDYKDVYVEKITTTTKKYREELGTLPTPTRSGYTFDGWYTDSIGGTQITSTTKAPANDVTYYAHWIATSSLADVVSVGNYVNYNAASGNGAGKTYTTEKSLTGSSTTATFNSSDTMKWKVISVDKATGTVELMAENPTANEVKLYGKTGYKNAETVLNKVGAVYGYGEGATGGRSITVEDVNKLENYTPKDDTKTSYTYTSGTFINEDGTEVTAERYNRVIMSYTASTAEKSTNKYYSYTTTNFSGKTFWLGSRCIHLASSICDFGVRFVGSGDVYDARLFDSNGIEVDNGRAVLPVVSLKSNIQTSGKDESGAWDLVIE